MSTESNIHLTLGSLFDGSGGFPLGGLLTGCITPLWSSEVEPFAIRVTTKRLPEVKHYGDVSAINGADLPPVDIITFGSPCQDMSIAGKRDGLDGSRSSLFYEAIRIVKEMRCTVAMGNTKDMEKAIEVLNEVKESIINAYAAKSGLTHARIANLMSNETWMNAKKAVELGFADEILFSKKEDEPDSDPADPDKLEETPDEEPGEGEEKKPFQQDAAGHLFSSRQMDLIVLNRLGVKPDTPAAQTEPPSDPPAEAGPVLDMDGKTEEGDYSYNVLMKQLECMK